MKQRRFRQLTALLVLILTLVLFVRYVHAHPQNFQVLKHISPWVIIGVLLLNLIMTIVLTASNIVALLLCGKKMSWSEMFLLTGYSSFANFFGPLQSGPGLRAIYLKTKYQVRVRDYTVATAIALGFFALWSGLFLLSGLVAWWLTALLILLVLGLGLTVLKRYQHRTAPAQALRLRFSPPLISLLALLSFVQVCIVAGWYFVELRAVDHAVSLHQVIAYTGAANFSLFVSITPDGLGIREAFLIFSQHIHHISTASIVSANIIDRAVYIVYLAALFILVLLFHAKDRFSVRKLRQSTALDDEQ